MDLMFYQLSVQPLERALPLLLEKALQRGWKAVVEVATDERKAMLDDALWTYGEGSFLPHGVDGEPSCETQPVLITTTAANSNGADIRFLVDGVRLDTGLQGYQRVALLFDGRDDMALEAARADWKIAKAAGLPASFWQQGADGRWEKKA